MPESPNLSGWLAAALLALALVLGGGGSPSPLPELALELLAVLFLLAWLSLPSCRDQWRRVPGPARLIAGVLVALP
ncbi:MAG: hypothetical protein C0515_13065, partial [Novosphingobium sp.]|nr:hypothetical protein [Novosphingobium sp.]